MRLPLLDNLKRRLTPWDYRVLLLCPLSRILKNTIFRKLGFRPQVERIGTPTILNPLKRANLNLWRAYKSICTINQVLSAENVTNIFDEHFEKA
jgi:hypothetical protein